MAALRHAVPRLWWTVPFVVAAVLLWPSITTDAIPLPSDIQYQFAPWSSLPDAPTPANPLLRDIIDAYHPEQTTIWERMRAGEEAGWLVDSGLGAPGWWFVGTGALSPFVLFGQLFGSSAETVGWSLSTVLRLGLAGVGVGLATRQWDGSRAAAAAAAGCFAASGFMIAWLGWPQAHVGAMVGWVWWAVGRTASDDAPWWAVPALGLTTAASWFGGFPAVAALLGVSAAAVAIVQTRPGRDGSGGRPGLVRCAAGLGLGTGIALVQLLPSLAYLDTVDLSARAEAWRGSLPVQLAARWVVPDVFGDGMAVPYWGRINQIEGAAYIGIPALILAVAAVIYAGNRASVRTVTGVAAISGLLVYGFPPLLQVIRFAPGLNTNPPARGVVLTTAALSVLAGLGVDAVRDNDGVLTRGVLAIGGLLTATASFVLVARPDRQVRELISTRLSDPAAREAAAGLARSSLITAAAVGLVTIALLAAMVRRTRTGRPGDGVALGLLGTLLIVTVADPAVAALGWNTQSPADQLYPSAPAIEQLTAAVDADQRIAGTAGVLLPLTDLRYDFNDARGRRFLTPELTTLVHAAGGEFSSPTRWDLSADPAMWTDAIGALGIVGVVVSPQSPVPADWRVTDLGDLLLAHVPTPTPWVSVAADTEAAAPGSGWAQQLAEAHPTDVVLLPADTPTPMTGPAALTGVQRSGRGATVQVDAPEGAVLRILEGFSPGWSATVDGEPAPVIAVDGAFVGVVVAPGATQVTVSWQAPGLLAGIWLSILSLLTLLGWTMYRRTTHMRRAGQVLPADSES